MSSTSRLVHTYAEQAKFYAFGVDAFYLTTMLNQLQSDATAGLRGATGVLYVTPQHVVNRQLEWAKIQDGEAKLI